MKTIAILNLKGGTAKSKRKRAYEKQIQMSGFPIKKENHQDNEYHRASFCNTVFLQLRAAAASVCVTIAGNP